MSLARAVTACLALATLAWLAFAASALAEEHDEADTGAVATPEQTAPTAEDDDPAARALPERVTGLRVKIGGPDSLTVLWDRGSASEDGEPLLGYLVQRSENREQWVDVTFKSGFPGLPDRGLTQGQRYWYRVRAVNEAGHGPWSETIYNAPAAPPATVTDLSVINVSDDALTVVWSAPVDNGSSVVRYDLERLFGADHSIVVGYWGFTEWPSDHTTFAFTVRDPFDEPGRAYRIRSWNLAGESAWSEPVIAGDDIEVPARPPSLRIVGIAPREIRLRWVTPDDSGSEIFVQQVNRRHAIDHFLGYDHWSEAAWVTGKATTTVETVFHRSQRTYRVRAWNDLGEGAWSPWASIRPGLITMTGSHEQFRAMLAAQCPGGVVVWGSVLEGDGSRWVVYAVGRSGLASPGNADFEAAFPLAFNVTPLRVDYCGPPTYLEPHVHGSTETLTIYIGGIERLYHALETECAPGAMAIANGRNEWEGQFVTLSPSADEDANAGFIDSFRFDRLWQEPLIIRGCAP
ncbi:MAG: fibronectin type III domain-containing protein [Chloroflexi bacterium]|nr:fibronectin type III domain-containing protein [Chloroflexota bacterium]